MAVAANPSPTERLRLEKQTVDSNENAWGTRLNSSLDLVDAGFAVLEVAVEADVTLTTQNYTSDQSRAMCFILSGSGGFDVLHPASTDKPYLLINNCTAAVDFGPDGQTLVTVRAGFKGWYFTNEAGTVGYLADITLDKVAAPVASVAMGSQKITGLADGVDDNDAVNVSQTLGIVTAAAASASSASDSAVAAAASAASAASSFDSFDDRYLGAKSSEPALDNDGDALVAGALFFDTVAGAMKVYDGAAWIALDVVVDYSDATFRISDDGDATKKVAFQASGVTTGTTRTLTVPDASGTIALTSDIPTSGYTAGTVVTLSSDATVDFTIDSAKEQYIFEFQSVIPATDGTVIHVLASTDSGSTYAVPITARTSDLQGTNIQGASSASATTGARIIGDLTRDVGNNTNEAGVNATVKFSQTSGNYGLLNVIGMFVDAAGNPTVALSAAEIETTSTITNLRFKFDTGDLASGRIIPIALETT
jgi:hypothetical protein